MYHFNPCHVKIAMVNVIFKHISAEQKHDFNKFAPLVLTSSGKDRAIVR